MKQLDVFQHATELSGDLLTAVRAADAAGRIIIDGAKTLAQGGLEGDIEQKAAGDLVSQVDIDADQAACGVLRENSDLPILSEELNCSLEERDNLWIVDPLDASSAYLCQAGDQYPSVLVAQRRAGETTLGVVYFPLTGQWFYALKGRGAWVDGKRLVCDSSATLSKSWVEMNHYGDCRHETEFFASLQKQLRSNAGARLVTCGVPNSGVAMRIALGRSSLAAAVHDNNASSVKQAPWDIAAPQVILEEAGGVFLNPRGQRSDPFLAEPIIVARSHALAQSLIELNQHATSAN